MKLTINYPDTLTDNDRTAMLHAITTESQRASLGYGKRIPCMDHKQ